MKPTQLLQDTAIWAGDNLAYNLKFIPDDKLGWKPEPNAKSALEICAEVVGVCHHIPQMFRGESSELARPVFQSREAAQSAVKSAVRDYAAFLDGLSEADLEGEMQLPFGMMEKKAVAGMPMVDTIHHHGQIAYIQTLLGDTESHFEMMGN